MQCKAGIAISSWFAGGMSRSNPSTVLLPSHSYPHCRGVMQWQKRVQGSRWLLLSLSSSSLSHCQATGGNSKQTNWTWQKCTQSHVPYFSSSTTPPYHRRFTCSTALALHHITTRPKLWVNRPAKAKHTSAHLALRVGHFRECRWWLAYSTFWPKSRRPPPSS